MRQSAHSPHSIRQSGANLTPEQRQRVLENYRQWQKMSPTNEIRRKRTLPNFAACRPKIASAPCRHFINGEAYPEDRRQQLRQAYSHFKTLLPISANRSSNAISASSACLLISASA